MGAEQSKTESGPVPGAEAVAPPPPRQGRKKSLWLGSGALILVASGWALAVVAVPVHQAPVVHALSAPKLLSVSPPNGYHVNLAEASGKHYLAVTVMSEVEAYDEARATERAAEPLYRARLSDAVLKTAARMTKGDLDDPLGKEVFRGELLGAIEAVLFPVHVGNPDAADERSAASGLGPGDSIDRSTMRGLFFECVLLVDASERTIQLRGGPLQRFQGSETDLEVVDAAGQSVWVDVSRLEPGFRGEVPVGVLGRVSKVYFTSFLVQ
jgi:flagellar basal body-associated protein FliL